MNLLKGLYSVSEKLGCEGIALADEFWDAYNFDNAETIEELEVYKKGKKITGKTPA